MKHTKKSPTRQTKPKPFILPCPFCGQRPKFISTEQDWSHKCPALTGSPGVKPCKREAIQLWNKRWPRAWQVAVMDVIAGTVDRVRYGLGVITVAPSKLKEFLEARGWKHIEPEEGGALETNGWQWDWWMRFDKDGQSFTASGSGYYGGFTFERTEAA